MEPSKPEESVADFITNLINKADKPGMLSQEVAATLPGIPGTLNLDVSSLATPPPLTTSLPKPTTAPAPGTARATATPAKAPSLTGEPLAADLANDELPSSAGKRPLAHFGQALPATKSKANRKLVLQLTPEMYQYLAHVATLPALDGVALPDLVLAVLQAWREDYRPDIKRANAAFKA